MNKIFCILFSILFLSTNAGVLYAQEPDSTPTNQEIMEDGPLERIIGSIKDELSVQKALSGVIASRLIELQESIAAMRADSEMGPVRTLLSEIKSLIGSLNLKPDFQPLKDLIANIDEKLSNLEAARAGEKAAILDNIKKLFDERSGMFDELRAVISEVRGSIGDLRGRLDLIPNVINDLAEARRERGILVNALERLEQRHEILQNKLNDLNIKITPLKWLANWIHSIITGGIWLILKIFGVCFIILLAIASLRLAAQKLTPRLYNTVSTFLNFLFLK